MNKLLAMAGIAIMITACAGLSNTSADSGFSGPGAVAAAYLGYHGPVHRIPANYGN
ncbi:MAG TPA: hypothetical protein VK996_04045 [Ramlibacter sp.]|nr:hypothetical protein [Ramlibacter sp.]